MNTTLLFAIQVALYILIPSLFILFKKPLRIVCFYSYLGILLVFANLLGGIYAFPILHDIKISGGNLAYVVLLFTIILMVILEQDIHIIRNTALIILMHNLFFFFFYITLQLALQNKVIINPNQIPPALFNISLKIVIIGTCLIIAELLLLFTLFEVLKRVIKKVFFLSILYPLFFVFVVSLDGCLFQIIAFAFDKNLPRMIQNGFLGKLILGSIFCIPLYLFLIIFSNKFQTFIRNKFHFTDLVKQGKQELLYEIRKQQTALHEKNQLIKAIAESVQDCIFSKDREFKYSFVNQAMCDLLKCAPEALLGKTPEQIFDRESAAIIAEVDRPVLEGKVTNAIRTLNIFDEFRIFHTIQVPIRNEAGEIDGICGIVRDVTELQRAEKILKRLNTKLLEKNKELEQIIYATSHDLRSPLVNIKGFSEELQYSVEKITDLLKTASLPADTTKQIDYITQEEIPRWVEYIITSITSMSTFLSSLLKISRLGRDSAILKQVDMNPVINSIFKSFEYQIIQKHICLEIGTLPPCITDSERIRQVFSNIIDNAIKYLKPGENGYIKITGEIADKMSAYTIEDNGIGIEEKYLQKIFEIFYRLNPRIIPGEGIGLSIVKKILSMVDGEIAVESTPNLGSKFTIRLPAVTKENIDEYHEK